MDECRGTFTYLGLGFFGAKTRIVLLNKIRKTEKIRSLLLGYLCFIIVFVSLKRLPKTMSTDENENKSKVS